MYYPSWDLKTLARDMMCDPVGEAILAKMCPECGRPAHDAESCPDPRPDFEVTIPLVKSEAQR